MNPSPFFKHRPFLSICTALVAFAASPSRGSDTEVEGEYQRLIGLLADGKQREAEDETDRLLKIHSSAVPLVFFKGACARSRFQVGEAVGPFLWTLKNAPVSGEGLAAACILGMDFSADSETSLAYFSALTAVQRDYPGSFAIQWMCAVMSRSLTTESGRYLFNGLRNGVLSYGVRQYDALLQRTAPLPGPVLVHQTYANILDSLQAFDESLGHRHLALPMERKTWSLDAMAQTLNDLGRYDEALQYSDETLALCIKQYQEKASAEDLLTPNAEQKELLASYHNRRGSILFGAGKLTEAAAEWLEAFSNRPTDPALVHYAGWRLFDEGKWEEARSCIQKALAFNYYPEINELRLRRIAVKLGEPGASEALKALDKPNPNAKAKTAEDAAPDPALEAWFLAAQQGDYQAFMRMVETTDIGVRTKNGYRQTALMIAAQAGDLDIVDELLRRGAEVNAVDANGDTALHYTAQFHQPRAMKALLDAGADTNIQDKWKQTALISCAGNYNGYTEPRGAQLILEKGADLEKETPHGGTALHYAAVQGVLPIVRGLLEKGANPEAVCRNSGATPLILSAQYSHPHVTRALFERGASVNARDKEGRTALHFAVRENICQPLYKLLLERGANPTLADKSGMTPIRKARLLGFEELALEMEKLAVKAERFEFPPARPAPEAVTLEESAFLASLPVALVRGHFPDKGPLPTTPARNDAKYELLENFGIQTAQEFKAYCKNNGRFEPRFEERIGRPAFLLEALDLAVSGKAGEQASLDAWIAANRLHVLWLGRAAGFIKAEEADTLTKETLEGIQQNFSSWRTYAISLLTGAAKHRGWEFERYSALCRRLVDDNPDSTPWLDAFWKGAAPK